MGDRELLQAFVRHRSAETFRPLVERYLPLIYPAALRQAGNAQRASEVASAVFLVFSHRVRKLRRGRVLASWLFHTTRLASVKLVGKPKRKRWARFWAWLLRRPPPPQIPWPAKFAAELDAVLDGLPPKKREAVLLRDLLGWRGEELADALRSSEKRANRRAESGLRKAVRRLRRRGVRIDRDQLSGRPEAHLRALLSSQLPLGGEQDIATSPVILSPPLPEGLFSQIIASVEESFGKKPSNRLARRTLRTLAWARWRRRVKVGVPCAILFFAALVTAAWYVDALTGHSHSLTWFLIWSARHEAKAHPELAQPARPWPTERGQPALSGATIEKPANLYQTTNIWIADLKFSPEQWEALEPKRIGAMPNFIQKDGTILLRNPKAHRSGLAGVLGFDFEWVRADFEFGGLQFSNVAARYKGNGTYLGSLYGAKRGFKVDLKKFAKGRQLGGVEELNFTNLIDDRSYMSDALAYEFFRDAGVPAPRTAYVWLTVSVSGQEVRKPLGLYVLVESPGSAFAAERFGSRKTPIFKPVTYELFKDCGNDWPAYAATYDLKTKATGAQLQRVIEFARLVSHAEDAEFAKRLRDFLDLDEFAGFLSGLVLLSSYDSLLSDGQNFYLYLDPKSNKFGFIPWDLDHAWGGFFLLGTVEERERASIWHPWVGDNRFLERVMGVEEFRQIYRGRLEDLWARLLVPERLSRRIDEIASLLRSAVAAESSFRLERFEQAVSEKKLAPSRHGGKFGADRPVHQLKGFIKHRADSVRKQLDGQSKGLILRRGEGNGG